MSNTDTKSALIIAALIAVVGTIVAAFIGFFGSTEPIRIPLEATQTAAAQFTAAAQTSASVPVMATTMVPASTDELTPIVIPAESTTPSVTPTVASRQYIGNWVILAGGVFKSSEDACDFSSEKPYSDYAAQVFQKDGFYRSVLMGFASEGYASEALRKIIDKGGRGEVRNLTQWCKAPVSQSGYILCQ